MLEAIETGAAIHASMELFERKFSAGGHAIAGWDMEPSGKSGSASGAISR
jgi:hypothetical protein